MLSESKGQVVIEAAVGTDHIEVKKVGRYLRLLVHHEHAVDETERYNITAETPYYLSAIQAPMPLPGVRGLVINKRLGSAIWTLTDSEFAFVSEFPDSTSVLLECKN